MALMRFCFMSKFDFPVYKTKIEGISQTFSLEDRAERRKYFDAKAGEEIKKIKEYLKENTFVGFLIGKKNSGKGTYSKLFMEAVGPEHVTHISVGDIVRSAKKAAEDTATRQHLEDFLRKRYRGFGSVESVIDNVINWSVKTHLATEGVLALVEWEIDRTDHKAVFIDGFPRSVDQISLALYFRALIGYRDDPDFFVFIDLPETIINERMKNRVICPICQTPRSFKLLRTKEIGYDETTKEFYLMCDNPGCNHARMVEKEGDTLGIEAIRDRIEADDKVARTLLELEGVPKIYLRNSVPVESAKDFVDEYEITPEYSYEWNAAQKQVKVNEKPWIVKDDEGKEVYSLLPAAVVVSLIKQVTSVLGL